MSSAYRRAICPTIPNPVPRVPPIQGFRHHLYTNIRDFAGCGPLGLDVSKLTHGDETISVIAGVAETPADSKNYLRALIIRHHDEGGVNSIDLDLAIEGDGLSPTSSQGLGLVPGRNMRSPAELARIKQSSEILERLIWGLRANGILLEGCLIQRRKLLLGFQEGLIDLLVQEALDGIPYADSVCDPNSLNRVPNLDFEIGTGILSEPETGPIGPVTDLVFKIKAVYESLGPSSDLEFNTILGYLIATGLISREVPVIVPPLDGQIHVSQMMSRLSGHAFYGYGHNYADPSTENAVDIFHFPILYRSGYGDWVHPNHWGKRAKPFSSLGVMSITPESALQDVGTAVKPLHELDFIEYDHVISEQPFVHDWFRHDQQYG